MIIANILNGQGDAEEAREHHRKAVAVRQVAEGQSSLRSLSQTTRRKPMRTRASETILSGLLWSLVEASKLDRRSCVTQGIRL